MSSDRLKILSKIGDQLQKRGFTRRADCIYMKPFGGAVQGWIGLNRASRFGSMEINLVVGVRYSCIEEMTARLMGKAVEETSPPTIAMNVGYTREEGNYLAVIFDSEESVQSRLDELARALDDWGLPFIEKNSDLSTMIATMGTSPHLMPEQTAYRLPVALHIAERDAEARVILDENMRVRGGRADLAAKRYLAFGSMLLRELS